MSAEKPPTMRQQIDSLVAQFADFDKRLRIAGEQKASNATPPPPTEASVIRDCTVAMDALREYQRNRSSSSYSTGMPYGDSGSFGRILRFLADRYGVALIDRRVEVKDCDRAHLDDLDPYGIVQALQSAPRGGAS